MEINVLHFKILVKEKPIVQTFFQTANFKHWGK